MSSTENPRSIADKQVRALVELLIADGWELSRITKSNHPMLTWRGPTAEDSAHRLRAAGNKLTIGSTPSDWRALRNSLSDARAISGVDHARLLRGSGKTPKAFRNLPRS